MDLEVKPLRWPRDQRVDPDRKYKAINLAEVKEGDKVFGIRARDGRWFSYAYLTPDYAERVCQRLLDNGVDLNTNFRTAPILVTARVSDEQGGPVAAV